MYSDLESPTRKNINRQYTSQVYKDKIIDVLNIHKDITDMFIIIDNNEYLSEYETFFEQLNKNLHYYRQNNQVPVIANATIQMLIASKCQYVIGNRISSFTELIFGLVC